MSIKVYDIVTDTLIDATQEHVNNMQTGLNKLAKQRECVRKLSELRSDDAKIEVVYKILMER